MSPRKSAKEMKLSVVTETVTQVSNNDRIPDKIWNELQACGETGVVRLKELLASTRFNALRGSDQLALIRLSLEYAFGKPEAPAKRTISQSALAGDNDAVSLALERLAGISTLPEHSD